MIRRWGLTLGVLSSLMLGWSQAATAHPDLGKEYSELFGSFAWGLYLMVPIPFLVLGVIGYLLYRASRSGKGATLASGRTSSANPRLN
ncbi:MAG TPA: hypothetical protein VIL47_03935 [Candidatus Bipolaricaulota bacterium]